MWEAHREFGIPVTAENLRATFRGLAQVEPTGSEIPTALQGKSRRWSLADKETVFLVLALKALVFIVAYLSVGTLFDMKESWQTLWNRWDATHYLGLAQNGYTATGEGRFSIVFYPLYPWMVRAFALVTQSYFGAALFVSGIASVGVGLLLRRLVELDYSAKVGQLAVWFLFIFPTAYFFHIGYSESLFLALVLGSVLAARRQYWALAGVLGALAGLARVNGLLLVPTLMVEAWLQYRAGCSHGPASRRIEGVTLEPVEGATRRINWRWLWIGAVGLGFVGYVFLNYNVTGDPFAFSKIMEDHWYKKITPPWVGVYDVWDRIFRFNLTEGLHEFIFIVISFIGVVWSWMKLRPTYSVWMTLNWLLITSTAFVVSVPRYCLTLFPLFILLSIRAAERPLLGRIVTAASLLLLAVFATKFAYGTWAF